MNSLPEVKILQRRQYIQSLEEALVYCSIVDKEISPWICLESQGQKECFGCSAPSHLCEKCLIRPLAFPEINLCSKCLHESLKEELQKGGIPAPSKGTAIYCHLTGREIGAATCRKMQGHFCGDCTSPARICEECKKRAVKYSQYGTCLSCTVVIFAPSWHYEPEDDRFQEVHVTPTPKPTLEKTDAPASNKDKEVATEQQTLMCVECKKRPVRYKKSQLCQACYMRKWIGREEERTARLVENIHLVEEAKKLVIEEGKATSTLVKQRLGISHHKARQIMTILEGLGLVSSAKRREVLVQPVQSTVSITSMKEEQNVIAPLSTTLTIESIGEMTTTQKIQFVEQFCAVMGNGPFPLLLLSLIKDLRDWEKAQSLLKQIKL